SNGRTADGSRRGPDRRVVAQHLERTVGVDRVAGHQDALRLLDQRTAPAILDLGHGYTNALIAERSIPITLARSSIASTASAETRRRRRRRRLGRTASAPGLRRRGIHRALDRPTMRPRASVTRKPAVPLSDGIGLISSPFVNGGSHGRATR